MVQITDDNKLEMWSWRSGSDQVVFVKCLMAERPKEETTCMSATENDNQPVQRCLWSSGISMSCEHSERERERESGSEGFKCDSEYSSMQHFF